MQWMHQTRLCGNHFVSFANILSWYMFYNSWDLVKNQGDFFFFFLLNYNHLAVEWSHFCLPHCLFHTPLSSLSLFISISPFLPRSTSLSLQCKCLAPPVSRSPSFPLWIQNLKELILQPNAHTDGGLPSHTHTHTQMSQITMQSYWNLNLYV